MNISRTRFFGFSLVELMISLIVISIVMAAFAPILTKRLKTSDVSVGNANLDYIFDEAICSANKENCSICIGSECVQCKAGYYLENENCKQCTENCSLCTSLSKCTKCDDGYYIDENGKCGACTIGCKTCKNSSTCQKCDNDFKLVGNMCYQKCDSKCEFCTNSICKKCVQGYHYKNGECVICNESDSISILANGLSVYKYNMGDECGPPIPNDVPVCYFGKPCTVNSANENVCFKTSDSISPYNTLCRILNPADFSVQTSSGTWKLISKNEFVYTAKNMQNISIRGFQDSPLQAVSGERKGFCVVNNIDSYCYFTGLLLRDSDSCRVSSYSPISFKPGHWALLSFEYQNGDNCSYYGGGGYWAEIYGMNIILVK